MGTWTDQPVNENYGTASVRAVYSDDETIVTVKVSTGDGSDGVNMPVGADVAALVADLLASNASFHDVTATRGSVPPYTLYTP